MWDVQPGEIIPEATGVRIRLSIPRTQQINPYSVAPIDAFVLWDRIQPSEDGNWHICIAGYNFRSVPFEGVYCVFAPPNT